MQMFSLTFLVITLAALFVAEFSNGQSTNVTQSTKYSNMEIEGGHRKMCCAPTLHRNDYVVAPGLGAYKIHKREVTWNDARMICQMEGAHLAVLDSARKETLFRDWMTKESLRGLWLGFHDLFREGSWTTLTGELVDTMDYEPWATGQPDNWNNEQHCGFLWKKVNRGAHDGLCNNNFSFVCEINLCPSINSATISNAEAFAKLN